ncbi:MAG: hypothetical protein HY897_16700 [Deltaproteobacteria bacterium]|nr:hypothetical protein [Deltaproteobacteria bacterium]
MKQSVASSVVALLLCGVVTWIFWDDVEYFFQRSVPVELGPAAEIEPGALAHNRFVSVKGIADYRVQFAEAGGKTYRYFILLGSKILVQQLTTTTVSRGEPWNYAGTGRLLSLSKTLKYDQFLKHLRDNPPRIDLSSGGYILLDGERPRDVWLYFAIVCVAIGIAVFSVIRNFVLSKGGGPVVSSNAER